jgi:hypothetical protein
MPPGSTHSTRFGSSSLCEDAHVIFTRRIVIALLLAAFRIWRRLPPEERRRVLDTMRRHGPRVASSLKQRARGGRTP